MDEFHHHRQGKKLKEAARHWSGGGNEEKKGAADFLGVKIEASSVADFEVWPENWLAFELLTMAQWQWVGGMQVARVGIDQVSAWGLIAGHPDVQQGKKWKAQRWELFQMLQIAGDESVRCWADK